MKLYTEEQINWAMRLATLTDDTYNQVLEQLTPIELPSDEEIEEGLFHQSNEYSYGYKNAFNFMRNKILNQNK